MKKESHNLTDVYDMPGDPGWEAITTVPCPVDGCTQTVVWWEAGYVPGYRVCMSPNGPNDHGAYDTSSIRHHFLGDPSGPTLILEERDE